MEDRLIPLNAILELATPSGVNRPVLAEAGYEVAGLEIPCLTAKGTVVVDVVLAHPRTAHLIACESKSGGNIEAEQAQRYKVLEAQTLVRGAFVTLRERVQPRAEVLYAAQAGSADRITYGLIQAEVPAAVLAVHADKITLENAQAAGPELAAIFANPVPLLGPPAQHIMFDQDSAVDEVRPHVSAALVAALTRRLQLISLGTLTEQAAPHYPLYGHKAQTRLRRLVGEAVRLIARDVPGTFEYHPPAGNHDGFVKLLRTPEDNDPRGRTQAYQKFARTRQPRQSPVEIAGQLSLLDELEKADNADSDADQEDLGEGREES